MAMTSLSIVLTVFVLQLHHVGPHQKPVPRWIRRVVIGYIARGLCMQSHIESYGFSVDVDSPPPRQQRREEMCLTTFMDNSDFRDSPNCNGGMGNRGIIRESDSRDKYGRITHDPENVTYDKISKHLKILVSKHDLDDDYQVIINEWRLVALIMDRLLFWIFFLCSTLSSVSILVFQPMTKPTLG